MRSFPRRDSSAGPAAPAPAGLADLGGLGMAQLVVLGVRATPVLVSGLALTLLLALLAGAGRIVIPLTVQYATDHGLRPVPVGQAVAVGAVATLIAGLASWVLVRRLQGRAELGLAELRRQGLRRVHEMAPATADRLRSADLVSRLTADIDAITAFVQSGGVQLMTNTGQMLLAAVLMTVYCWQLALPAIVIALALFAVMRQLQKIVARRFDRVRTRVADLQAVVAEAVTGADVIRSTGSERRMRARLDRAIDRARDAQLHTQLPLHSNTSLGEVTISTITVLVVAGGVWWTTHPGGPVPAPELTAGELVAMVLLVTFFVRPLQFMVQALGEAQNALAGWRRALELVSTPSAVVDAAHGPALPAGAVPVELEGVRAAYGDGPPVLHDLSVRIEPGRHVAVVGETGSGKSTFAKVITRRLAPTCGQVLLGGVPLDRLADAELERRVVIVPQDPFLFDTTIGENIAVALPGVHADAVRSVVASLGLRPWLDGLPDGLDTRVGLRGERLSTGERQLVALARTALVDPDLVVLDEATSGVDPATDVRVQHALAALTEGRTTISIAHRMITARDADRVLVFDGGRIVQDGPHAELVAAPGRYAQLYAVWQAGAGAPAAGAFADAATTGGPYDDFHRDDHHHSPDGRRTGAGGTSRGTRAEARFQRADRLPHRP